jgi:plasmid stabilization system protein ParE
MAARRRRVVWSEQAARALDEAVGYVAQDSLTAARRLLDEALAAAASLDVLSERGPIAPEIDNPAVRQLLIQRYRLLYEVADAEVHVLAFLHQRQDITAWRRMPSSPSAG